VDETTAAKRIWRRELRRRIGEVAPAERHRKSTCIVDHLRERLQRERPATVAIFAPLPSEPDLMPLLKEPVNWVFPKIDGERLTLWKVANPDHLLRQPNGLREPDEAFCSLVFPGDLSWVLVPGLGFGRDGSRLGRGKGYYDRLLKEVTGRVIGVAFTEQVEPAMPRDEWDHPMEELLTEEGWLPANSREEPGDREINLWP